MKKLNQLIFNIHSITGLVSGLFILSFALTGSIILFHHPVQVLTNSNQMLLETQGKQISFDSLTTRVQQAYPQHIITRFNLNNIEPEHPWQVRLDSAGKQKRIYINQYSGQVLGELDNGFADWIYKFHHTFQLDRTGEWMALAFAFCFLIQSITGLIYYRKYIVKALTFQIPIRTKNTFQFSAGFHRVIGTWALLFTFIMSVSGMVFMWHLFEPEKKKEQVANHTVNYTISIDKLIAEAKERHPDFIIGNVRFPIANTDSSILVRGDLPGRWYLGEYMTQVKLNAFTGQWQKLKPESELTFKEKTERTFMTLHMARYGGLTIKLIYLVFALCTATLCITGFYLWYRRTFK